jgi:hypothetical protein
MACVTSVEFNRMRILAPVARTDALSGEHYVRVLEANFHTALDARYATSDGVLYSIFLHPLSSLGEAQLRSALYQVASLAGTFGTTYTSGTLSYGEPM